MNVYLLLDRSGSMSSLWSEAIGSINGYVKQLKKSSNVYLALFDSVSYDVVQECKAKDWIAVDGNEYFPRGGTPLYDSCGKIMAKAEEDKAKKTVLVVMTDGFENSSKEYTQKQIKERVEKWNKDKNWEVVFLGANFDAVDHVSATVGVANTKSLNISSGNFADAMRAVAASTTTYCSAKNYSTAVASSAFNFSDEDKLKYSTTKTKEKTS